MANPRCAVPSRDLLREVRRSQAWRGTAGRGGRYVLILPGPGLRKALMVGN
jgi:hypothetical protein